ncbi:hypothetical protein CCYA_CCYA08G2335 [Cyanidiococcus yangmingshanensis]|nr:hypothetical protein CCYA_CCYA08G2335 [Cyanidiococcus yangmingshanensis]
MESTVVLGGDTTGCVSSSAREGYELGDRSAAPVDVSGAPFPLWANAFGNSNGSFFGFGLDQGASLQHLPSLLLGNSTLLGHTQAGTTLHALESESAGCRPPAVQGGKCGGLQSCEREPNNATFRASSTYEKTPGYLAQPSTPTFPADRAASLENVTSRTEHRVEVKRPKLAGCQVGETGQDKSERVEERTASGANDESKRTGMAPVNVGVWSDAEMELFYKALREVGRDFHAIARIVRTRSASQVTGVFHRCLRRAIDPVKRAAMIHPNIAVIAESLHLFDRVLQPDLQIRILLAARELEGRADEKRGTNSPALNQICMVSGKCSSLSEAINWTTALLSILNQETTTRKQSANGLESVSRGFAGLASRPGGHVSMRCDGSPDGPPDGPPDGCSPLDPGPLSVSPSAPPEIYAAVTRKKELSLQIVPLPGSLEEIELERFNKNPRILLTLRLTRKINAVFDYLAEKWGPCITASYQDPQRGQQPLRPEHALRLRVCTDSAYTTGVMELDALWNEAACRNARENGLSHWLSRATDGDALLVGDIHRRCGSPAHIRLQYAWIRVDSDSCLAPGRNRPSFCALDPAPRGIQHPSDSRSETAPSQSFSTETQREKPRPPADTEKNTGESSGHANGALHRAEEQIIKHTGSRRNFGPDLDDAQCSTDSLLQTLLYGMNTTSSVHGNTHSGSNAINEPTAATQNVPSVPRDRDPSVGHGHTGNRPGLGTNLGDSSSSWLFSLVTMRPAEPKPSCG